jgi:nicotinamide-nucleotide amidase
MSTAELIAELTRRGQTVAAAESLTGGLLCSTLIDGPGASVVVRGGLVVYATDLKSSLAGVPAELLRARGAVDPDVATALARGVRERCGADWGLATTGVAGPDPQDGVGVGTVFVAVAGASGARVRELALSGDRHTIRFGAVTAALELLAEALAAETPREEGHLLAGF